MSYTDEELLKMKGPTRSCKSSKNQEWLLITNWWVAAFYIFGVTGILRQTGFNFVWLDSIVTKFIFPFLIVTTGILLFGVAIYTLSDIWQRWLRRQRKEPTNEQ